MLKEKLLKQVKPKPKLGAFQVQVSTTMSHYIVYINLCFMGLMFWHTTAAPWLRQFYGGAQVWMFAIFMLLIVAGIGLFDYKFVYPSRQAFISRQAYKHDNPAIADLQKVLKNQKKIMEKLGIEDD